jgi:hypothetical protein
LLHVLFNNEIHIYHFNALNINSVFKNQMNEQKDERMLENVLIILLKQQNSMWRESSGKRQQLM